VSQSKAPKKYADVPESVALKLAENRDVLLLNLRYDIYDSRIPSTFLRSAPAITEGKKLRPLLSPQAISSCRDEDCFVINLTSELGAGATGVVHGGTLYIDSDSSDESISLDVVVKLAFDREQRDALEHEYEMYRLLRLTAVVEGIAVVLGFFDDFEGHGPSALVMLNAGDSLGTTPEQNLLGSQREAALTTLESIHRINILHGDIRPENILVSDSGITIIDFAYSRRCNSQAAKHEEYQRFRSLLGLDVEGSSSE